MATHTSEILVHASASRIFDALTKPELVARWQFGRVLRTTWEAGSEIRFRTEWDGGERVVEQWGTVREVLPGRVVEYDLFTPRQGCEDVAENYCVTRYVLCADGARTKVAIVQRDDRPDAFVPESLANILISLKAVAEED
jgi:hypothetical protein